MSERSPITRPMTSRKNAEYLEWIRSLKCAGCGLPGPSEAHHLKGDLHMSGAGMKAPDYLAMPLCRDCHRRLHDNPPENWVAAQRAWLILTLSLAFELGYVELSIDSHLPF